MPHIPHPASRTRKDLTHGIHEILQCFYQTTLQIRWEKIKNKVFELPLAPKEREALSNAVLESTMINLRALDEFFRAASKSDRKDDMKAYEYGYESKDGPILSEANLKRMNKQLAHLTWSRITDILPYYVIEGYGRAIDTVIAFLTYLLKNFFR